MTEKKIVAYKSDRTVSYVFVANMVMYDLSGFFYLKSRSKYFTTIKAIVSVGFIVFCLL